MHRGRKFATVFSETPSIQKKEALWGLLQRLLNSRSSFGGAKFGSMIQLSRGWTQVFEQTAEAKADILGASANNSHWE